MPMKMAMTSRTKGKKMLESMTITKAKNGGHIMKHNFAQGNGTSAYQMPEEHAFGPEEGHEALSHIAKHMGIEVGKGGEHEESPHMAKAEN